jgi:hypothetical protein
MFKTRGLGLAVVVIASATLLADHLGFSGSSYSVAGAPRAVVVADLNDDGKADFASADMQSGTVTLYRGQPGPEGRVDFIPWAVLPLTSGAGPFDVKAADLNRDGNSDVIVANADNNTVSIFAGTDDVPPALQTSVSVSGSPRGVVAADLNRDGKLDLAVTGANCNCLTVLRNNGGFSFTQAARVTGLSQPHGLAIGDFNHDDIPDLAVSSTGAGALDVLVGQGNFQFARQRHGPAPATRAVVVVDYDRDGWDDIVTANTTTTDTQPNISVFRNDNFVFRYVEAAATLVNLAPPGDRRGIAVLNIDGDGWLDLAFSVRNAGRVEYASGIGRDGFVSTGNSDETRGVPADGGARGLSIADVNQDGRQDIVVGNEFDGSVSVLINISEQVTGVR